MGRRYLRLLKGELKQGFSLIRRHALSKDTDDGGGIRPVVADWWAHDIVRPPCTKAEELASSCAGLPIILPVVLRNTA